MENVGPGSYAKSGDTAPIEKKKFGGALAAAFGSVDSRKLDTTEPDHRLLTKASTPTRPVRLPLGLRIKLLIFQA